MTTPAEEAAAIIQSRCEIGAIDTAFILGRVFFGVADLGERVATIPYAELPGFPVGSGVEDGELIVSMIDGLPTVILKGSSTFHETGDPSLMASALETLTLLGVRYVLCTGLVLSVQADLVPSSIVLVTDHINFTGLNPLIGAPAGGKAMINMNEAYDKRLLRRIKTAAATAGVAVHEGVMMWFSGPSFETPAEAKVARQLGADILGWTIIPEAILARRYGLLFSGIAVVTDFGAGFSNGNPSADLTRGSAVAGIVATKRLLRSFVKIR
ncbi:phosphorylase [Methylocystis parvus]|uniref:purine-nucleoside phosphorylase n=1 Tax=Methylocystis parvus TaxID=134 RepID=A0A6B8M8K0_9HYPH|nr:phosphorylase [Methylocystis parvus]QGM99101.1 phosphorylase [Methylocystis parvus]WBK00530.1 phosphorylase [Methylocystis parvus OBBP]